MLHSKIHITFFIVSDMSHIIKYKYSSTSIKLFSIKKYIFAEWWRIAAFNSEYLWQFTEHSFTRRFFRFLAVLLAGGILATGQLIKEICKTMPANLI